MNGERAVEDGTDAHTRQLATLYGQQIRRGRRQAELVKALMDRHAPGSSDLDSGIAAARRTAAFVYAEGWVTGALWKVYGPQWLLARWALDRGVSSTAIADRMAVLHEDLRERRRAAAAKRDQLDEAGDRPAARDDEQVRKAQRRRARALDRARRQADALDVLFQHLLADSGDIEGGLRAADHSARFAIAEGWVRGSLWSAYGMQLLLSRWAIEQGITSEQIAAVLASKAAEQDEG